MGFNWPVLKSDPPPPAGKKFFKEPSYFGDYRDMKYCGWDCGLGLTYHYCCETCKEKLDHDWTPELQAVYDLWILGKDGEEEEE